MKQNSLFNMPRLQEKLNTTRWIPEPGDTVYLKNINDGIQAEVVEVQKDKVDDEYVHPFKCWIPKLKMHVWSKLGDLSSKPVEEKTK